MVLNSNWCIKTTVHTLERLIIDWCGLVHHSYVLYLENVSISKLFTEAQQLKTDLDSIWAAMKICASFIVFRILIYSRIVKSDVFEKSVKYPLQFYNEVSPCPCDLTENRCDTYCCCDQVWFEFKYIRLSTIIDAPHRQLMNIQKCFWRFNDVLIFEIIIQCIAVGLIIFFSFNKWYVNLTRIYEKFVKTTRAILTSHKNSLFNRDSNPELSEQNYFVIY